MSPSEAVFSARSSAAWRRYSPPLWLVPLELLVGEVEVASALEVPEFVDDEGLKVEFGPELPVLKLP